MESCHLSNLTAREILSAEVNIFENAFKKAPIDTRTIFEVLKDIQNGVHRPEVTRVREIYQREGKSERYRREKTRLKCVSFGGTFEPTLKKGNLQKHSGLVIADLDEISDREEVKRKICSDPCVLACFYSPSSAGLKFLIAVPVVKDDREYKRYLKPIERHFKTKYGIEISFDKDGKDVSRLCFVCDDPGLYLNENAKIFAEVESRENPRRHRGSAGSVASPLSRRHQAWKEQAIKNAIKIIAESPKGSRHSARLKAGFLAGGWVAGGMLSAEEILPLLKEAVAENTELSLDEAFQDVLDAFESGKSAPITFEMKAAEFTNWINQQGYFPGKHSISSSPRLTHPAPEEGAKERAQEPYYCTELGNCHRFLDNYGEDIRYNHTTGNWHIWDETRWAVDKNRKIESLAKKLADVILSEAIGKDCESKLHLMKHAIRTQSHKNLVNTLNLAKSDQGIAVLETDLDQDPYLFNTLNRTIDLRSGEIREHRRSDLIARIAPVVYDRGAEAPLWEKFLRRIFRTPRGEPDFELISFLQQAVAHSLTGAVIYQYLFFAYGVGANGKSTFFETIGKLAGDYYHKAPVELITVTREDMVPTDIADLAGKRFVVTSEVEDCHRLAEAKIKNLTGGDTLTGRFMRQDFFTFAPTHKLWAYGNHKPRVKNLDHGIWRRILLIPFTEVIPQDEQDEHLKGKLIHELPGILNWCLEGARSLQERGLVIPKRIREASDEYRAEMDKVQEFLNDCCIIAPGATTPLKDMYDRYQEWAQRQPDVLLLGRNTFNEAMAGKGFRKGSGNGNVSIWFGIGLLAEQGAAE